MGEVVYRLPRNDMLRGQDGEIVRRGRSNKIFYQFPCPSGNEPVPAFRSGEVVETRYSDREVERDQPWTQYWDEVHETNFVVVMHGDSTFGKYVHVKPSVKNGQKVDMGSLIGSLYGGARGTLPHLHFCLFKLEGGEAVYLPARFGAST